MLSRTLKRFKSSSNTLNPTSLIKYGEKLIERLDNFNFEGPTNFNNAGKIEETLG